MIHITISSSLNDTHHHLILVNNTSPKEWNYIPLTFHLFNYARVRKDIDTVILCICTCFSICDLLQPTDLFPLKRCEKLCWQGWGWKYLKLTAWKYNLSAFLKNKIYFIIIIILHLTGSSCFHLLNFCCLFHLCDALYFRDSSLILNIDMVILV